MSYPIATIRQVDCFTVNHQHEQALFFVRGDASGGSTFTVTLDSSLGLGTGSWMAAEGETLGALLGRLSKESVLNRLLADEAHDLDLVASVDKISAAFKAKELGANFDPDKVADVREALSMLRTRSNITSKEEFCTEFESLSMLDVGHDLDYPDLPDVQEALEGHLCMKFTDQAEQLWTHFWPAFVQGVQVQDQERGALAPTRERPRC